jgi:hypothetical protein
MKPSCDQPQVGIRDAVEALAEMAFRTAERATNQLPASICSDSDLTPDLRKAIVLEFLIANVHLIEREAHRMNLQGADQLFLDPLRVLTLLKFARTYAPGQQDLKPFLTTWDSALQEYCQQEVIFAPATDLIFPDCVCKTFGHRVASLLGETRSSFASYTALLALASLVLAHTEEGVVNAIFQHISWPIT